MFHRPTLATLDTRTEHQVTIITLEAVDMVVLVQCSDAGSFRLALLWHDWLLASITAKGEHPEIGDS